MLTRLQAKFEQSTDLVTSSGANPPGRSLKFRQVNVAIDNASEAGSPSWLLLNGSYEVWDFSVSKCKNKRCESTQKE